MLTWTSEIARRMLRLSDYRKSTILLALFASVTLPSFGCRKAPPPLPETYPVHGKVVFPDGTPVSGGVITFQYQADTSIATSGLINSDGTFTLTSFRNNLRRPGAVAGPHSVMVTASLDSRREMQFPVKRFPKPLEIKPGDNEFTLTVEK